MADFDNGLPPEGTDITDNNINGVNISKSDADIMGLKDINAINISKSDADIDRIKNISSVNISKEDSGQNVTMFL